MSTLIGDLEIKLAANIARLQQNMDEARRTVGNAMDRMGNAIGTVKSALGALGLGLSVAAFAVWIKGAIDAADAASKLSAKTGVAVKDLAGLQLAFDLGGAGGDMFAGAMTKLSKAIVGGNDAFTSLGIKTRDASGGLASNKDVLYQLADQFAEIENDAYKVALAVEVFGKTGADLIPLLNGGSQGFKDMEEMSRKLGLTLSEETAKSAEAFNDNLDLLSLGSKGLANQLAAQMLPTLTNLSGSFLESMTSGDRLLKVAGFLSNALKGLYTVAVGVIEVFSTIGKVIAGNLAIATTAFDGYISAVGKSLKGDFKGAFADVKDTVIKVGGVLSATADDVGEGWKATAKTISTTWSGAGDEAFEAQAKLRKLQADLLEEQKKREEAAKKAAAERAAQSKQAQAFIAALEQENAQIGMAAEQIKMLAAARAAAAAPERAQRDRILELATANGIKAKSFAASAEAEKAAAEISKRYLDDADGIWNQVRALEAQIEMYGLVGVAAIDAERTKVAAQLTSLELSADETRALEMKLAGLDRLAKRQTEINGLDAKKKEGEDAVSAAKKANEDMVKEYESTVEKYGGIFRQGFADMLNNGKAGWSSFTKSLVTTFKTSVADQLYKMFIQPFVMKVVASVSGSSGGGLADMFSSGGGGAGGALSSMSSLFSAGKTMFSGFSTALSSGMGNIITNFGNLFGSQAAAAFGTGMSTPGAAAAMTELAGGAAGATTGSAGAASATMGASVLKAVPIVGWIAAGMSLSNSLYKKGWDAQNGSISSSGPLAPFNAPMLGLNKLLQKLGMSDSLANMFSGASTVSRLFGRKNPEVTASGIEGTFNPAGFTGQTFQNILEKGGVFRSDKRYTNTGALAAETDNSFDETIKSMITAVKGFGDVLGVSATQIDGYWKSVKLTLTSDEAKNQELIVGMFSGIGDELSTLLLPTISQFSAKGETAAATLQRLAMDFAAVDVVLGSIGKTFGAVGPASIEGRERLLELVGGVEAFAAGTSFFAQNFMSEAERLKPIAEQVKAAMAELGLASVDTRAEFAEVYLGLDLTTKSGAETAAALLNVQERFAMVTPAVQSLAVAADEAAEKLKATNDGYQQQIKDIERSMLSASDLRAAETQGMDKTTEELYDLLHLRQAEKKALDDLNVTNAGYESQILALEKAARTATQQREFELSTMDDSTKALYFTVEALEAVAKAARKTEADARALAQGAVDRARTEHAESLRVLGDVSKMKAPFVSMVDQLLDTRSSIAELTSGLEGLTAAATKTPLEKLAGTLQGITGIKNYRAGLGNAIQEAAFNGMNKSEQAASLRAREATLYGQLGSAADPVAVASSIQATIIQRIRLENEIRSDGTREMFDLERAARDAQKQSLESQISGFQKIMSMAAGFSQFTSTMRFGDLSALNFEDQLASARSLFESTLSKARLGDEFALGQVQGNGQAYIQELRSYTGSSGNFSSEFTRVLAEIDGLAEMGRSLDPQVNALKSQIEQLDALNVVGQKSVDAIVNTAAEEVEALSMLDMRMGQLQVTQEAQAAEQISLLKETVAQMERNAENLERIIVQQTAIADQNAKKVDTLIDAVKALLESQEREALAT